MKPITALVSDHQKYISDSNFSALIQCILNKNLLLSNRAQMFQFQS